jgi:hypothetical protein
MQAVNASMASMAAGARVVMRTPGLSRGRGFSAIPADRERTLRRSKK